MLDTVLDKNSDESSPLSEEKSKFIPLSSTLC